MYDSVVEQYKKIISWLGSKDAGIFAIPGISISHDLDNTLKKKFRKGILLKKKFKIPGKKLIKKN